MSELGDLYDSSFYDDLDDEVHTSAGAIAPMIVDFVQPRSVLDVGCGRGTWLAAFSNAGVADIVGVDGPHVQRSTLEISSDRFVPHDLTKPLDLGRKFDLVVSLEVGEHLDAASAPTFVASLVAHAPLVLFSAAVPNQGGAGHVNEQWPSYWARRFAAHGYVPVDAVRARAWHDERVSFWYAQNTLLYVDPARVDVAGFPPLTGPLDLVHPDLFARQRATANRAAAPSVQRVLRDLPPAVRRAVSRRALAAIPAERRIKGMGGAKGRGTLQVRKLIAPVWQRPVTLTTADGLRLRVGIDPVDEKIAQHVLGPNRRDYFPRWPDGPPAAPCILDVGAHHGYYAASALHEFPDSTVICVEPSAAAIEVLRANLALNNTLGRARIVPAGLAPSAGEGQLLHTDEGTWGASLYEDPADATSTEPVRLLTLDSILDGAQPDIIKCNAEGAEYALIEQLAASDLRPAFMVVMVHPEFGDLPRLLEQAANMGYRVTRIGTADHPAFQMWRVPGESVDAPAPTNG